MANYFNRLIRSNIPKVTRLRSTHFSPAFRYTQDLSESDEQEFAWRLHSFTEEWRNIVSSQTAENKEAFLKDPRWESFMNEIRDIDPYTANPSLLMDCIPFIQQYLSQGEDAYNAGFVYNLQKDKLPKKCDPDADLCYLLIQNIMERSNDPEIITTALMQKFVLACTIMDNGDNFRDTVERLLSDDHASKLTDTQFIWFYNCAILIGSWKSLPLFQAAMDKRPLLSDVDEYSHSILQDTQNIYEICALIEFDLPDYERTSLFDNIKVKRIEERLTNPHQIKYKSKEIRDKVMSRWIMDNNEFDTHWKYYQYNDSDALNVVKRIGTRFIVQLPDGGEIKGPCFNEETIHCRQFKALQTDVDEETLHILEVQNLLLVKNSNGNYEGNRHVQIETLYIKGKEAISGDFGFGYKTDFVMELQ